MRGLGLVGCGLIADFLGQGLREAGGELRGACDVDEARARRAAQQFGGRYYADYEEMLSDKGIDAVIIALPNFLHFEFARRALEAGKDVLCEKPLTTNPEDSLRLVQLAEQTGRVFQVGYMKRYHPCFGQIKERLGDIGEVCGATFKLLQATTERPEGPADPATATWHSVAEKTGGGVWVHSGSHLLDLLQYTLGRPTKVWGRVRRDRAGNEYDMNAFFLMEAGCMVHLQMASILVPAVGRQNTPWEESVEVVGEEGVIRAEGSDWKGLLPTRLAVRRKGEPVSEVVYPDASDQWRGEMAAFLEGIGRRECLGSSVEDGYWVDCVLKAMSRIEPAQGLVELKP